jgi:hypothetical protein
MNNPQDFWNDKFKTQEYLYGLNPNAYIKEKSALLKPQSNILCLAEGEGRNALHLALLGHALSALDASNIAMDKLHQLLAQHGYSIDTQVLDLAHWQPLEALYDAITTSYLHIPKPLLAQTLQNSIKTLKRDGLFIGEFFSINQLRYNSGGPKALEMLYCIEDFAMHQGVEFIELKEEIVELDEGVGHQGEASVIRVLFKKL